MDEIEVPTDAVQEEIRRCADESREQWITRVALSTAILAVFAAVTALLAGQQFPDSKKCREIGTFVGEAS